MSDPLLGKTPEATAERDAVHVAIIPAVAGEELSPGQRVGIAQNGLCYSSASPTVGIVDPFLVDRIVGGGRFWLVLYPGTVTGMRHHWAHPAFGTSNDDKKELSPEEELDKALDDLEKIFVDPEIAEAEKFLEGFASRCCIEYQELMEAAEEWIASKDYTYENTESYKDLDGDDWRKFWAAWEMVMGRKPDLYGDNDRFFTCSC